ncbi:SICA-like antigen [Plasmodium coatneyi]|uniref:SICA-like antigen n=1 Tax=Plasmodium coatneyi TaxID=208452 RepID=A0A1B1DYR1_9APIC|nr:SICA-like antigen [Plasmodium coatneyi]ANQ07926.1 SICA-like antigen [Plasmodium coatneyi]
MEKLSEEINNKNEIVVLKSVCGEKNGVREKGVNEMDQYFCKVMLRNYIIATVEDFGGLFTGKNARTWSIGRNVRCGIMNLWLEYYKDENCDPRNMYEYIKHIVQQWTGYMKIAVTYQECKYEGDNDSNINDVKMYLQKKESKWEKKVHGKIGSLKKKGACGNTVYRRTGEIDVGGNTIILKASSYKEDESGLQKSTPGAVTTSKEPDIHLKTDSDKDIQTTHGSMGSTEQAEPVAEPNNSQNNSAQGPESDEVTTGQVSKNGLAQSASTDESRQEDGKVVDHATEQENTEGEGEENMNSVVSSSAPTAPEQRPSGPDRANEVTGVPKQTEAPGGDTQEPGLQGPKGSPIAPSRDGAATTAINEVTKITSASGKKQVPVEKSGLKQTPPKLKEVNFINTLIPYIPIIPALVGIVVTVILLWKYFTLGKRRRRYRRAHPVRGPPTLEEQLLDNVEQEDITIGYAPYGYDMVKVREPRHRRKMQQRKRVTCKTIIDIHFEVLDECQKGDTKLVHKDFIKIIVEEYMSSECKKEKNIEKGTQEQNLPSLENLPLSGDLTSLRNLLYLGNLPSLKNHSSSKNEHQSSTGVPTCNVPYWINWIEGNMKVLVDIKTQGWFHDLKVSWKEHQKLHLTMGQNKQGEVHDHGDIASTERQKKKKDAWKWWVSMQHSLMETYNKTDWFIHLLNNSEDALNKLVVQRGNVTVKAEDPLGPENVLRNPQLDRQSYKKEQSIAKLWMLILALVIEECEMEESVHDKEIYLDNLLRNT